MQQQRTQRASAQAGAARADVDMLTAQRSELQVQLRELGTRRSQLFAELGQWPDDATKRQVEGRLREIDGRMSQLDNQISGLNNRIIDLVGGVGNEARVVAQGPTVRIPQITIPPVNFVRQRGPDMREVGGIMAAEAVVLALIGLAFWRFGMRRMREQFDRMFSAQTQQLSQLQQAMDTVAVEVERISEAQRYVAKVLTEGSPATSQAGKPIPQTVPRER